MGKGDTSRTIASTTSPSPTLEEMNQWSIRPRTIEQADPNGGRTRDSRFAQSKNRVRWVRIRSAALPVREGRLEAARCSFGSW